MRVIEDEVNHVLTGLKSLHDEIETLRANAVAIEMGIIEVNQEYADQLQDLNREAMDLKSLVAVLRMQRHSISAETDSLSVTPNVALPSAPTPLPSLPSSSLSDTPQVADPRDIRKRDFADYLLSFMDDSQQIVMQRINAILADDQQDVGNMLEVLAWGDIWKQRMEGEDLSQQLERLELWRTALEERHDFWASKVRSLEKEPSYHLLREKQARSAAEWKAFLDDLALHQAKENEQLKLEVELLRQSQQDEVQHGS